MSSQTDAGRVYDGFTTLTGGMNGGVAASLINADQLAFARDVTFRDGYVSTRPPFSSIPLTYYNDNTQSNFSGIFQDAQVYQNSGGLNGFMVSVGGRIFTIDLNNDFLVTDVTPNVPVVTYLGDMPTAFTVPSLNDTVVIPVNEEGPLSIGETVVIDGGSYQVIAIYEASFLGTYLGGAAHTTVATGVGVQGVDLLPVYFYETAPVTNDYAYIFQAETYGLVMNGQAPTVVYDGSTARTTGPGELPTGAFGIYLWGRIWITLSNRRGFVAGDLVYDDGTIASILSMTENKIIDGGGAFTIPSNSGPITGMIGLANLDTSTGQGNLMVGTSNSIISSNTPVDRTTWQNLNYPIQTIALGKYGPKGAKYITDVNGDVWYRSQDGVRSFVMSRRENRSWGNTPQSREVAPILNGDDRSLLEYGCSINFDNRLIGTCGPQRTIYGVVHQGLVIMNFDLVSSLRNNSEPAWEGVWTGLQIFKVVTGEFNGVERAFAFVNNSGAIELWELLREGWYDVYDNNNALTNTPIQPVINTRAFPFGDTSQLKKLYTAEIYLDEVVDTVTLVVKFRPDQYANWTTWATATACAEVSQCALSLPGINGCTVFSETARGYSARIMLPQPPETCNPTNNKPICLGYQFQIRIEGTGHFRIQELKLHAKPQPDRTEGACPEVVCQMVKTCGDAIYGYDSHG